MNPPEGGEEPHVALSTKHGQLLGKEAPGFEAVLGIPYTFIPSQAQARPQS